jgi:DNA-binding NarL/FixJ family response regulator
MASTPASIRRIKDPAKRAQSAAALLADVQPRIEQTRAARDAACLHLLRNEGRQPVQVYRLAHLSRRLFGPIAATIPAGQPAPEVADAEIVAAEMGEAFWRLKRDEGALTEIRGEAVQTMLAEGLSNVEVARAANLSTARIAQIRRGR